ncbi:MAG: carbohydrate kinase [Lachnospiraceae bacterium]|nr:carbohydrate kinase [Lachnospiraceae bacterium]
MKQYDVVALGELLIDFTEQGMSGQGNPVFEANPGGAPCNVLAMLSRLGHRTAFLGKVGDDMFGRQLETALQEVGIETRGLKKNAEIPTTLAFVHTLPGGDRKFSFYRNPGADMTLTEDDLEIEVLEECRIFHFGTLSMTHEGCRAATRRAVERAKAAGAILSFDPNLRESLWRDPEEARSQILYGLGQCDILKISDNEIVWLTGETDYDCGVAWIRERFDIPLILVSLGKSGSLAFMREQCAKVPAVLNPHTVETTGAGDTFCACILHYVLSHGWRTYTGGELAEMLRFANAAASIITTRKGALRVMPTEEEVRALMGE